MHAIGSATLIRVSTRSSNERTPKSRERRVARTRMLWGAQAASPPEDGFAVANL